MFVGAGEMFIGCADRSPARSPEEDHPMPASIAAALCSVLASPSVLGSSSGPLSIARNKTTSYAIVVAANATAPERSAAAELKRCLERSTGTTFKVVDDKAGARLKRRILLGRSALVQKALGKVDWTALGTDGIILRTVGQDLVLTGGRPRGVYYAVCEFLERVVGWRWWAEDGELAPTTPSLTVPPLSIVYTPKIVSREPHFYLPNHSPEWCAHNKANGHFNTIPAKLGGNLRILGWCHTFYALIPPQKYFASHPEWFSEIGGRRRAEGGQLCLTNEALVEEISKNALEWIRKDPDAGFISIAQNDWYGRCECPNCLAIEKEDGSPSGPLVRFVNAVAERIEKEFPSFKVETLAYQYTRKAPRVSKPRRNVVIRLCSIECDYGLPLSHPRNASFMDDLKAWLAVAPHLYIWTYIARFGDYWYPNPCLRVYEPNIRAFADHHAIGVFMQGDSYNAASCFVRLRSWVNARLLWNPSLDSSALIDEFLRGYYGAAAPHLRAYLRLIEAAYDRRTNDRYLKPADVLEGYRLFDAAEKAVANNPTLRARVRRERFPLDYVWATEHRAMMRACRETGAQPPAPEKLIDAVRALRAAAQASNTLYRSEGGLAMPRLDSWLATLEIEPGTAPKFDGVSSDRVIQLQEPDIRLFNPGGWVDLVDDPAASNGKACKLRPGHTQWAVQGPFPEGLRGKVRVYASLRRDGGSDDVSAGTVGIFDARGRGGLVNLDLNASILTRDAYRLVDLGGHEAGSEVYVWVAPSGAADGGAILVDRFVLVEDAP